MNRLLLLAPRIATNRLWARAGEVPSFHVAPLRTGNARDLITGSVLGTYNSASPAWAVGPDGVLALPTANAPVIEYDPTTLQCLGARIREAVVNLSLQSRDLTQAAWTKSGVTATRDQIGADGVSNTATRLTATSSDGTCLQTITSASATRVSGFYIRRITGTGTVEITQNGGATWTAVSLTSTFARYSIASATIANPQIGFRIRSNGDEIAVDFAQLQSASTLGPPVATTTTSASSTADVWSITGADFSRIINQSEGTVYWSGSAALDSATHFGWAISSSGDYSNSHNFMRQSDAQPVFRTLVGGATQYEVGFGANWTSSNPIKQAAYAYRQNDFAGIINGVALVSDASGSLPTTNRIELGALSSINFLNGYIQELAIFRSRRPNSSLQAMTS